MVILFCSFLGLLLQVCCWSESQRIDAKVEARAAQTNRLCPKSFMIVLHVTCQPLSFAYFFPQPLPEATERQSQWSVVMFQRNRHPDNGLVLFFPGLVTANVFLVRVDAEVEARARRLTISRCLGWRGFTFYGLLFSAHHHHHHHHLQPPKARDRKDRDQESQPGLKDPSLSRPND